MTPIISRYGLSIRMEVGRARFYRRAGPGPGSTYCADARLLVGTATRRFKSGCGLKTVGSDGRTDGIEVLDGLAGPTSTPVPILPSRKYIVKGRVFSGRESVPRRPRPDKALSEPATCQMPSILGDLFFFLVSRFPFSAWGSCRSTSDNTWFELKVKRFYIVPPPVGSHSFT